MAHVLGALWLLGRGHGFARVRLAVAQGALYGLAFKVAATLLKTIVLHTPMQLAIFVAIFALRTLIKHVFAWEQGKIHLPLVGTSTPGHPARVPQSTPAKYSG